MKRLSRRQRDVLLQLSRRDGSTAGRLGAGSHSGNVLEGLLVHDLIRCEVVAPLNRFYITDAGRDALRTGRREN